MSFVVPWPVCRVPDRGGPELGLPLPSGVGRLVVKDAIAAGAAPDGMADAAMAYLPGRSERTTAGRSSDPISA